MVLGGWVFSNERGTPVNPQPPRRAPVGRHGGARHPAALSPAPSTLVPQPSTLNLQEGRGKGKTVNKNLNPQPPSRALVGRRKGHPTARALAPAGPRPARGRGGVDPTPQPLNPVIQHTPDTLQHASYTLHPISYIIHHTRLHHTYTIHPTPYNIRRTPYTLHHSQTLGGAGARVTPQPARSLLPGRAQPEAEVYSEPSPLNPARFWLCIPNPQPSTLNPQPSTLNPQPCTLNPEPCTLNPKP